MVHLNSPVGGSVDRLAPLAGATYILGRTGQRGANPKERAHEVYSARRPRYPGIAFVGTPDEVRRQLAGVQDNLNPEYFLVFCDQGLLPLDEVKAQIGMLAELMPEFMD